MKTLKELAKEAIQVQDACNLSGVVHSFSRAMTDLREIARAEGWESTDKLNTHPICVLWADKIAHLTDTQTFGNDNVSKAYDACHKLVE